MKKIKLAVVCTLFVIVSFFALSQNASAASSTSFNFSGTAGAFGGYYQKFVAEDTMSSRPVQYMRVNLFAHEGNKLKVSLLQTYDWVSTANVVASTGTLEASYDYYVFYIVPANMSCPAGADFCLTMPKEYSSNGLGNDIGYDINVGFRCTNESWFYGDLEVSGTYILYYT